MDLVYALLILLGMRHPAPAVYHAPVKTLPLVIETPASPLGEWDWGTP
jgi:hypothetical protein